MRKRVSAALALALAACLIAALLPLGAAAQVLPAPVTALHATLTGAQEVPPGDPDGRGSAVLILVPSQGRLCYVLQVEGIAPAAAAHVHVGPPGTAGPVVVPLAPPTRGVSGGCVAASEDLLNAIAANPGNYYVNVHNAEFPGGALRGQLSA
jgi:hypothetical protein